MKVGMRVCVCGGGPIGLLALQTFKLYGATSLTMIEPIADRPGAGQRAGGPST